MVFWGMNKCGKGRGKHTGRLDADVSHLRLFLLLRPPKPPPPLPLRFVRMAYLAVVASHTVNGVAAIHSEIIKVRGWEGGGRVGYGGRERQGKGCVMRMDEAPMML